MAPLKLGYLGPELSLEEQEQIRARMGGQVANPGEPPNNTATTEGTKATETTIGATVAEAVAFAVVLDTPIGGKG